MHTITAWKVVETAPVGAPSREVHVLPEMAFDDLNDPPPEHETSEHCFCQPDVEVYKNPLFIHRGFEN